MECSDRKIYSDATGLLSNENITMRTLIGGYNTKVPQWIGSFQEEL